MKRLVKRLLPGDFVRHLLYTPICDALDSHHVPYSILGSHSVLQEFWENYQDVVEAQLKETVKS